MVLALTILRYAVFVIVAFAAVSAALAMLVQQRRLNPFGRTSRIIRRATDPLIRPIERRVLRSGGNPQYAPWWMLAGAILGGIIVISFAEWLATEAQVVSLATQGGSRSMTFLIVDWAFTLVNIALIVRVVGSWFGIGPYVTWMRPFYAATEWFLAPLRRVLPAFGPLDISPIVAWLLLSFIRSLVMKAL